MAKQSDQQAPVSGPVFSSRREALRQAASRYPKETPNPVPIELPMRACQPESLREEMMRFIRTQLSQQAREQEMETFEEFDDFDDEEPDMVLPPSPYTVDMKDEPGGAYLYPEEENGAEELSGAPEASSMPSQSPEDRVLASAEPARESEGRNPAEAQRTPQQ